MIRRSFFSCPARPHRVQRSIGRGIRKEPLGQVSSQYSYHSSSGNKVRAKTALSKPAVSIITSVMSEICSVILSRKALTIRPTPKFLMVSARNFRFMQAFDPVCESTREGYRRQRKRGCPQKPYLSGSYPSSSSTGNNIAEPKTFTIPREKTNHIVSASILSERASIKAPTIRPTPKALWASKRNLNLFFIQPILQEVKYGCNS